MKKTIEAVKYMISVWDEVTDKTWRQSPDHVQQKILEAEKELIEAHKLDANNLIDWKSEQRILHASCIKSKKMLFCDLHGNYEVYKKGELTLITNQAHKAIKEYNQL